MTSRWHKLGLGEPGQRDLPENPSVADLAVYALRAPGCTDPVEGILAAVKADLYELAEGFDDAGHGKVLAQLARRVDAAMRLLRRADGR